MKEALDRFSGHSKSYKKFRPVYPQTLYTELLSHMDSRESCWDCGTGNGQVALALARYFQTVYASDISREQIQNAEQPKNVQFHVERAESTSFESNFFDLITVAQAIHWFDLDAFGKEVYRVSKNGGLLAVWGYGLLRISKKIDARIDAFYSGVVGPYWDRERRHIDNG
ncbi:MAG: class I SAM-dependent methyltransferase, partial [Bacteroidota bacterium]